MADIETTTLLDDTLLQLKKARVNYNDVSKNYNEANRRFQLGELDRAYVDEALSEKCQAYGYLQSVCRAYFNGR
ncbi:hypothetical protein [Vibrio sp. HN007]|uniref:hypothetical protein n=1 Tax=Vibrio iocasae TaxID=3098914 RepID=UPI0035D3FF6F